MDNDSKPIVSMFIRCNGGLGVHSYPLIFRFKKIPIFRFLPGYAVDASVVPNLQEIRSVTISDQSVGYFVFLMNNWNRECELFCLGKTTLNKSENKIVIHGKELLSCGEFSDIVFISEFVFYELMFFSNSRVFFKSERSFSEAIHDFSYSEESVLRNQNDGQITVYTKEDPVLTAPRKIYFNLDRWNDFFSVEFRDLVDMQVMELDFRKEYPVYSSSYSRGETISFTLPSFKEVKKYTHGLLCKHIYVSLFGETEESLSQVTKKYIVATLKGYGWIHVIHSS